MFEDIKKNKMKSWIIVLLFLVFIALIIYYICMALDLGKTSIIIAMIFAIVSTWGSYYYSDKIVLSLNKARPATKEENQKLVNILDALVVSSGLQYTPKLYIVEDSQPNAFATELNKIIAANTGQRYLIMKLNIFLRRKAASPCMTSSSTAFTPMTRDTSRQMVMAAIGIITELVRKSKKSRNCMPMIFTAPSGP